MLPKKISALFAATLFGIVIPFNMLAFDDVDSSHTYSEAIEYVNSSDIVNGYPDGTFKPDNQINRAEFTKIIIEAYFEDDEINNCNTSELKFTDTPTDSWFAKYICLSVQENIITGYPDNTFKPDQKINYAEAAKIISEVTNSVFEEDLTPKPNQTWYTPYLQNIKNKEAIPQTITSPEHSLTRGETAYIIFRMDLYIYQEFSDIVDNIDQESTSQDSNTESGEEFAMTPEDCFPQEKYDPEQQICYYECDGEEECAAIEAAIAAEIEKIGEDYWDGDETYQPVGTDNEEQLEDVTSFISYEIKNDNLANPTLSNSTDSTIQSLQSQTENHQKIWEHFKKIFPQNSREMITTFEVFTDGPLETLAAVTSDTENPKEWILMIDITDALNEDGSINNEQLTYSLVHEFGHTLTLNDTQIPTETAFAINPEATEEEILNSFQTKKDDCKPNFYLPEGCAKKESYISQFYQKFWTTLEPELEKVGQIEDEEKYEEAANKFYEDNQEKFITAYASTNIPEDLAESWTAFILSEKPTTNTIADQKVKFFYQFEELIKLRTLIRTRLHSSKN